MAQPDEAWVEGAGFVGAAVHDDDPAPGDPAIGVLGAAGLVGGGFVLVLFQPVDDLVRDRPAAVTVALGDGEVEVVAPHVGVVDHQDVVVGAGEGVSDRVGFTPGAIAA